MSAIELAPHAWPFVPWRALASLLLAVAGAIAGVVLVRMHD